MTGSDVAVVGAGIAGLSVAWHLALAGRPVTVIDAVGVAGGASGVNAGMIDGPGWGRRPDLDVTLKMGSLELFNHLDGNLGHDIELRRSGAVVAVNDPELDAARARVRAARSAGFDVELIEGGDIRQLEAELSPALAGVIFSPRSAQADPLAATRAIALEATRAGARLRVPDPVVGIAPQASGGWEVRTGATTVGCDVLVLAAGAWSAPVARLAGLELPVVPVKGQMWATAPLPARISATFSALESARWWADHPGGDPARGEPPMVTHRAGRRVTRHLYGRQRRNGEIVVGGDRLPAASPEPSIPEVDRHGIDVNRHHAAEVLPLLAGQQPVRTWAGWMPFTLDGAPLLGPVAGAPGVFVAGGLASSGFNRGPMAGKLVAQLILGQPTPPELADADPARPALRLTPS